MSAKGDCDTISHSNEQLLSGSELRFRSPGVLKEGEIEERRRTNMAPSRVTSGYSSSRNVNSYSSSAEYHRVGDENRPKPVYTSLQYKRAATSKVPWRSIGLAVFLSVVGTSLMVTGFLLLTGHVDAKRFPPNRTWPMIAIGFIMFVPGVYHLLLAIMAWWGHQGYSFEDIPGHD